MRYIFLHLFSVYVTSVEFLGPKAADTEGQQASRAKALFLHKLLPPNLLIQKLHCFLRPSPKEEHNKHIPGIAG